MTFIGALTAVAFLTLCVLFIVAIAVVAFAGLLGIPFLATEGEIPWWGIPIGLALFVLVEGSLFWAGSHTVFGQTFAWGIA